MSLSRLPPGALGHPARIQILRSLMASGTCVFGSLARIVPLAPSTMAQHLASLQAAGVCGGGGAAVGASSTGCCGGLAPAAESGCCVKDAAAKKTGLDGCGCRAA